MKKGNEELKASIGPIAGGVGGMVGKTDNGARSAEMTLVRMLKEGGRSWVDMMDIIDAIGVIQRVNDSLQQEREYHNNSGQSDSPLSHRPD